MAANSSLPASRASIWFASSSRWLCSTSNALWPNAPWPSRSRTTAFSKARSVNLAITASFHAKISRRDCARAGDYRGRARCAAEFYNRSIGTLSRLGSGGRGSFGVDALKAHGGVPVAGLAAYLVHVGSAVFVISARGGAVSGQLVGQVDGLDALGG